MLADTQNRKVCNPLGIGENKMKYKVRWIELIEYAVEVEADSREDASTEALFQSTEEHRTGWGEVETDSIEVEELKE